MNQVLLVEPGDDMNVLCMHVHSCSSLWSHEQAAGPEGARGRHGTTGLPAEAAARVGRGGPMDGWMNGQMGAGWDRPCRSVHGCWTTSPASRLPPPLSASHASTTTPHDRPPDVTQAGTGTHSEPDSSSRQDVMLAVPTRKWKPLAGPSAPAPLSSVGAYSRLAG